MELRDRQSLAYTVAPMSSDSPERGMFGVYIGCAPEKLPKALSGIRLELAKVIDKPIMPKELARAKQYWLGRYVSHATILVPGDDLWPRRRLRPRQRSLEEVSPRS
jgi:predicted Zn-dependent peptidase